MRVRFWGTRGSLPRPGPRTLRYGGNTSCVEVRTDDGTLLVLDCGTGAQALGEALAGEPAPRTGHLLITHTHWDHIHGFPFFAPFFTPGNTWHVYGPGGASASLRDTLAGQMQYTYFPIALEQFAADLHYHDLVEGTFEIDGIRVTARYLNHPALTLGYRLEADGAVVVYSTDHEPHASQLGRGGVPIPTGEDEKHARFVADADLLIHDAQYTQTEYRKRVGWGHSPVEFVVDAAARAGVRCVALFHHDPARDDAEMDRVLEAARERAAATRSGLRVVAAAEGEAFEVAAAPGASERRRAGEEASPSARSAARVPAERPVLLAVGDPDAETTLAEAARAEGLPLLFAHDADAVRKAVLSERPALVILQRDLHGTDALDLCRELRPRDASPEPASLVVVARDETEVDAEAGAAAGVSDWLVPPFKPTYARARLRAWLLRTVCRWQPAPPAAEEPRRLEALRALDVLDTEPEERFDRITRIAAAVFDVPIALVSLIDADRQWFKSRHGLEVPETPREMALCAHAILYPDGLVVRDALADDRFADNPLVTGPPRLRFYAGAPLSAPSGHRVGTLCLIDRRPRAVPRERLGLLRDLADLVERELTNAAA